MSNERKSTEKSPYEVGTLEISTAVDEKRIRRVRRIFAGLMSVVMVVYYCTIVYKYFFSEPHSDSIIVALFVMWAIAEGGLFACYKGFRPGRLFFIIPVAVILIPLLGRALGMTYGYIQFFEDMTFGGNLEAEMKYRYIIRIALFSLFTLPILASLIYFFYFSPSVKAFYEHQRTKRLEKKSM